MVSKNKQQQYPQVANYDDQIIALDSVQYDLFYYGDQFEHATLSPQSERVIIGKHTITLVDNVVTVDEQVVTVEAQRTQINALVIIQHTALRVVTTNLPRQIITISESEKANIKVTQPTLIALVPQFNAAEASLTYQIEFDNGKEPTYFNQQLVTELHTDFKVGDRLVVAGIAIERRPTQFKITVISADFKLDQRLIVTEDYQPEYPLDFPEFRRSPRIIRQEPKAQISINRPETIAGNERNDLFKTILPPLGMLTASFATALLSNNNPMMMLGMGSASMITIGISVSSYFTNKKETAEKKVARKIQYEQYIVEKAAEVKRLSDAQHRALDYHYPDMNSLADLVFDYSPRIYEKSSRNADYLRLSLGIGNGKISFKLDFDPDEQQKDEPLVQAVRKNIIAPYGQLTNAQITTSFADQTIGLIGVYSSLKTAVQTQLLQLATFHSYHDVEMLILVPEQYYEQDWDQWRWLPHLKMKELNLRGIVHNAQTRDMVLNSFYQLLNKRRQIARENDREKIEFSPHYILTILDDSWLAGHGLNEFLAEDMSQYGVTVIWGKEDAAMLPETVTTMIAYDSEESATLINENGVYIAQDFKPYKLPTNYTVKQLISRLANLTHLEVEKNSIPAAVTFLGMYAVSKIPELRIEQRWQVANTSKSLAVPLGLRGKDDLVYLNLHERAHGPHGLVAGTTGSGKSETVQSYLLSLAVNFAPEDVGFLPIDFKGGGMANLFADLPHLLGSITNLDGAGSARALASIRAELQKRQRLFGQFGVNHINGYTKLYKAGKTITNPVEQKKYPAKPLPHLFLVSDEFAELKANEPDFMAELVSTARIGRSLGVHLILATQKPSGVVDDQIWSNSRFKLALKVQDVADSNEILKTPDAASIVEPGRAYLQVGNNEIYELFQSAWSGAQYTPNQTNVQKVDERIWVINDYGQADLLTTDLSDEDEVTPATGEEAPTQLEALVTYIAQVATETKAVIPDKPWLPPLAPVITTPVIDVEQQWQQERQLAVSFGKMDIPAQQKQIDFKFDLEEFSHTVICGSAGFGKSTALQTLVMNLARENTPEQVQFNLFDFGTNGLLPLKDLPHVVDIVRLDEDEKLIKFLTRIRAEMQSRKEAFAEYGVASLSQFEQKSKSTLPISITIIDSFDATKEDDHLELIESVIGQLLREGASLGMYAVMTTLRTNSLRMNIDSNIPTHIGLYLVEEGAIKEIVGRDALIAQEILGRAQIKLEVPQEFQIYLPNEGANDVERLTNMTQEIAQLAQDWTGSVPDKIPMLPKEISMADFYQDDAVQQMLANLELPLAFDKETTKVVGFKPAEQGYFLIADDTAEQIESFERVILENFALLADRVQRVIFDSTDRFEFATDNFDLVVPAASVESTLNDILDEIDEREHNQNREPIYIYVPDVKEFGEITMISTENLRKLLKKGPAVKIHVLFQGNQKQIENGFDDFNRQLRNNLPVGIFGTRVADQGLVNLKFGYGEPIMAADESYYFEGRAAGRVRLISK